MNQRRVGQGDSGGQHEDWSEVDKQVATKSSRQHAFDHGRDGRTASKADKVHSEHNASAFGWMATERAVTGAVEASGQAAMP